MKYLILDTNIYIHFIDFEQIDWMRIFNDNICIVIPPKVQREIDKLKDQSTSPKKRKKAKQASAKIADYLLNDKSGKYQVKTCKDPRASEFDEDIFNKDVADNWILLSAIRLKNEENIEVILVAADNGILVKAKQVGLNYYQMPDKYKLKEELSDEEKEINNLKAELDKYKNRLPKPCITFANEQERIVFKKPSKRIVEEELKLYMDNLKIENPFQKYEEIDTYNLLGNLSLNSMLYTDEQIEKYNTELEEYFEECEKYQSFVIQKNILDERFKEITFELHNDGSAQTGDMNIFIRFPHDIKLYNKNCKIKKDKEEPIKPELRFGVLDRKLLKSMRFNEWVDPFKGTGIPQIYCWNVEDILNVNEFNFKETKMNHNIYRILEIPDSLYIDISSCHSFSVDWFIVDSKLIDGIKGSLNIIIQ